MADVNERRKAQNRAAQKKYRELVDTCPETEHLVPQVKPARLKTQRNHVTMLLIVLPQVHDRNCASNSPELSCAISHTSRPMRRTGAIGSPRLAIVTMAIRLSLAGITAPTTTRTTPILPAYKDPRLPLIRFNL